MKIAFTLCSNNYLAQAKTLGDSLIEHNPDCEFMVCLVDKKRNDIDYDLFLPHKIVEAESIGIPNFDKLCNRYGLIELNTAIKPFFFKYLFKNHPDARGAVYLDPDILVFSTLNSIYQDLNECSVVLTPHILSPLPQDELRPQESVFLTFGIYNLGFIAVANVPEGQSFLAWWGERTFSHGFDRPESGLFVDQLWLNLATVFFKKVKVSANPGLNVAYWNLHERQISIKDGLFLINESVLLVFYHFSSYKLQDPSSMSPYQDRYSFETRPDIAKLFEVYRKTLAANGRDYFSRLECHYVIKRNEYLAAERRTRESERKQTVKLDLLKRIIPDFIKSTILLLNRKIDSLRSQ